MGEPRAIFGSVAFLSLLLALDALAAARDGAHHDSGPLGRLAGSLRDRVLDVVGPDEIVERVDVDAVLERIDVDALLDRVDVDRLLARVDVNVVLARVEPDVVLTHVDIDALLARVDLAHLLDRVDLDELLARVDVRHLVRRAGIPEIVAESTTSVSERVLDMLRRQLLGLDVVTMRGVRRVLSRDVRELQTGPPALVDPSASGPPTHVVPVTATDTDDVTGHYAGPITRVAAFLLDLVVAVGAFTVASSALSVTMQVAGAQVTRRGDRGLLVAIAAVAWLFVYWWASTAVAGRTPGMALVGLRVVSRSGTPISGGRAFVRVLTLLLSVVVVVVALLVLVDREHRALHDVVAGSTVVYDWGGRSATMPTPLARWLEHHAVSGPPRFGDQHITGDDVA